MTAANSFEEFVTALDSGGDDITALMARLEASELTDDDQAKLTLVIDGLSDVLPDIRDLIDTGTFFGILFGPFTIDDLISLFNEYLDEHGVTARIRIAPTYRTEPIPGAELGGQPRNPEADVIDKIDELVDWQMNQSAPGMRKCGACWAKWDAPVDTCPECGHRNV